MISLSIIKGGFRLKPSPSIDFTKNGIKHKTRWIKSRSTTLLSWLLKDTNKSRLHYQSWMWDVVMASRPTTWRKGSRPTAWRSRGSTATTSRPSWSKSPKKSTEGSPGCNFSKETWTPSSRMSLSLMLLLAFARSIGSTTSNPQLRPSLAH